MDFKQFCSLCEELRLDYLLAAYSDMDYLYAMKREIDFVPMYCMM